MNPETRRATRTPKRRAALIGLLIGLFGAFASDARAGVIFGLSDASLAGGFRWDAAPLSISMDGTTYERSLAGGLRYSVEGGSFEAYRNMFSWVSMPSVAEFSQAIADAFAAWTSVDPASGLATSLYFVPDLATRVEGTAIGGGVDTRGAEIDLLASPNGTFWSTGNNATQAETFFGTSANSVTLTSGVVDYAGTRAISGADITINNNPGALYSLDVFRRLLTHEIGHALGLGDVEGNINPGMFIDDDFSDSTSATALATLTDSWALLVDPFDPAASPLARFTVDFANPGSITAGVDLLMESRGLGIASGNPVTNHIPLTNDEYGTRQFLYPNVHASPVGSVPEPAIVALIGVGLIGCCISRRVQRPVRA